MGAQPAAIALSEVGKRYGPAVALENLTLSVAPGTAFGLLGPNGAGKSTVIKILTGLIPSFVGEATLFGIDVHRTQARLKLGYLPELFHYPQWMTGEALLRYHGQLIGLSPSHIEVQANQLLMRLSLWEARYRRIGSYSKGMQQRLGLAVALLGTPRLLLLDEPTSALDPIGRVLVRDLLLEEKQKGTTIFLNSHLLGEVEHLCDAVAILDHGRLLRQGSLQALLATHLQVTIEVDSLDESLRRDLAQLGTLVAQNGNQLEITFSDRDALAAVAPIVVDHGAKLFRLAPQSEALEAFFVQLLDTAGQEAESHA
ncbi:MAG: ABC transporter ATP-binding protein [Firmicutes bacterium]|nr:ABC transporter ATP-binding protein [Bacillota bacterium]